MTRFTFDGRACAAEAGDTVASALYRAGRRVFSRSFKYHRPRGLLCVAGRCPNCLVNVDGVPNVRACTTPVQHGMRVRHQNAVPSLEHGRPLGRPALRLADAGGLLLQGHDHAPGQWRLAEPLIRRVAGLGEVSPRPTAVPDRYEHEFARADVAVIGGGPAGMLGAIAAASGGGQVVLVDDQPELGGHLRYQRLADPHWLTAGPGPAAPGRTRAARGRRPPPLPARQRPAQRPRAHQRLLLRALRRGPAGRRAALAGSAARPRHRSPGPGARSA